MRAIVYPHKVSALPPVPATGGSSSTAGRPVYGRRTSATASTITPVDPDDYLARLGKHVPAEALATFLLLAGLLEDHSFGWRAAAIAFTAVAAVILDRDRRRKSPEPLRAMGIVYDLFVLAAFAGWALGTTAMARSLIGIDQAEASLITLVVAFALARFDDPLGARFGKNAAEDGGSDDSIGGRLKRREPRSPG